MLLPIFIILLIKVSLVKAVIGVFALVVFCIILGSFFLVFISFVHLCKKFVILGSGTGKPIFTSPKNDEPIYRSEGVSLSDRVGNPQYSAYYENIYNPIHGFLGRNRE